MVFPGRLLYLPFRNLQSLVKSRNHYRISRAKGQIVFFAFMRPDNASY